MGQTNQEWEQNRINFSKRYKDSLPLLESIKFKELKFKKNKPLVSIIIPVYNYGKTLDTALTSVFDQTYQNLEIIIIDDGSTDPFTKLKLDNLDIPNTKIIRQKNGGPSNARNEGVKICSGEYILPLDSDDIMLPTYVEECMNTILRDKTISPVYCDTIHEGEMKGVEKRPEWSKERLIQGPFIVNCSMFSKEAFDSIGGFDESLKGWEDYDFWLRMMQKGYIGKRIAKPLFVYFHHEKEGTVSTIANQNMSELHKKILVKNKLIKDIPAYQPLKNNNSGFNIFT